MTPLELEVAVVALMFGALVAFYLGLIMLAVTAAHALADYLDAKGADPDRTLELPAHAARRRRHPVRRLHPRRRLARRARVPAVDRSPSSEVL